MVDRMSESTTAIREPTPPTVGAAAAPALSGWQPYPPRSAAGLDPLEPRRFAERVETLRRHHRSLPERRGRGGVFLLDLDELRRRFAGRWVQAREKAYKIVEAAISRRLGPNDLYLALPKERFVLLLTDIERAAAERLARRIAGEITDRLCGMMPGGVACRASGTALDLVGDLDGVADLAALEALLETATAPTDGRAEMAITAFVAKHEQRYAPVVNVAKRLVSIQALSAASPAVVAGSPPAGEAAAAARDRWLVAAATRLLETSGFRAAVLIQLRYPTLASMRHREPLMLTCRRLPVAARRRLLIELVDLPSTLPQARVRELVSYLKPFTVGVFVRLDLATLAGERTGARVAHPATDVQLAGTGIAGLSLDVAAAATIDAAGAGSCLSAGPLAALAAAARRLGLRSLCHVGADRRLCRAALISGIDHLTGAALLPPTSRPARVIALDRKAPEAGPGASAA
jgi:GGDEF domain-containing protein